MPTRARRIGREYCLALAFLALFVSHSSGQEYFTIQVVDADTGRGIPLAELSPVRGTKLITDSNGIAAFNQADLMDRDVICSLLSYGYTSAGQVLHPSAGDSVTWAINRLNRAERLYRVTGADIYRDSVLVGANVPIAQPLLNAGVTGQDSVQTAIYQGKIHWFWGDTNYADGHVNFRSSGATSELPGNGALDPSLGVNLNYFLDGFGNAGQMMPIEGPGLMWLDGLFTIPDDTGQERLLARYERHLDLETIVEQGLALWNDGTNIFERFQNYNLGTTLVPQGHSFRHTVNGEEYIYFTLTYPNVRVKVDWQDVIDLS
jgi:hypothetical protein